MANPIRVDDLAEIERRVVMPVVRALLREEEVDRVTLSLDAPHAADGPGASWLPATTDPGSVWLTLVAVGEEFHHMLVWASKDREEISREESDGQLEYGPSEDNADFMANTLYDQLSDWVVETRFSWGEHRSGDYVIPPAKAESN